MCPVPERSKEERVSTQEMSQESKHGQITSGVTSHGNDSGTSSCDMMSLEDSEQTKDVIKFKFSKVQSFSM